VTRKAFGQCSVPVRPVCRRVMGRLKDRREIVTLSLIITAMHE